MAGEIFRLGPGKEFLSQNIWYTLSAILAEQFPAGYTVIKKIPPDNSFRAFFITPQKGNFFLKYYRTGL